MKKAQMTINFLLGIVIFLAFFAVLSGTINYFAQQAITTANMTGTEALLMSNINLFVIIGLIIAIFTYASYSTY